MRFGWGAEGDDGLCKGAFASESIVEECVEAIFGPADVFVCEEADVPDFRGELVG